MANKPDIYASEFMTREKMNSEKKRKSDEKAQEIIKDFQRRASARGNFETQWQEIAERIDPIQNKDFNANSQFRSKGEKRTEFIFDSTAALALDKFASILDSLLTPRNQTWHRLNTDQPTLSKSREVKLYFEQVNDLLFKYRYAPSANFASQNQQNYSSLGAYGTGCLFTDQLSGDVGLRYRNVSLSQVFFAENHQGIIDEVIRYFPMTVRQAFQKWGDNLPDQIKTQLKVNPEQEFYFLHCVKPNLEADPERKDYKGMPFKSYYVCEQGGSLISEGGYNSFPYAVSRYKLADNEVYGRSPAMMILPAIKTLNEQKKTLLKQGHRAVDPVLLVHDDGIIDNFSLKPGSMNPGGVTADGRPLVHALQTGNISVGKEMMDDERKDINDAFLINLFQILTESPQMTATEVLERTKEKGILLAPTIGRQQSEYLGPLIERELDLLAKQRILPEMPQELIEAQGEYRVQYDSPLSRAQRAEEASGISRTVEYAINIAATTQDMSILDHFNFDVIIPEMAEIQGVHQSWMNDPKVIAQKRQGRAQQAQAEQIQNSLPGVAAMTKAAAVATKGK